MYVFGDITKLTFSQPRSCIGDLPAGGGSRGWELCDRTVARIDTGTTFEWPAPRSDGTLAFVRRRFGGSRIFPYYSDFAIQRAGAGQVPESVFVFPWRSPTNGKLVQGLAFPRWVDLGHLIALARMVKRDQSSLLQTGLEIVVLEPALGASGISEIPGTLYASSVAVGVTGDTIYFTLGGDSLVYRRTLSSGTVDTVVNFGLLGIARDVRVAAGKLIAVVGGDVAFRFDSILGMAQVDRGGPLYAVQLSTGAILQLADSSDRWQHPALAPDGSALIAEQGADLWRIPLP